MDRVVSAFSEEQTERLAKISGRQLRYWTRTGFFRPSINDSSITMLGTDVYSFEDVVSLRVLGTLRNVHGVSLQHLRKVRDRLTLEQSAWANSCIYVLKKNVYFDNELGGATNGETGEDTLPNVPLRLVIENVRKDTEALKFRDAEQIGQLTSKRAIARNGQVFAGTRIPVAMVKEYFDEGFGVHDIILDYPTLTRQDVEKASKELGLKVA